MNVEKELSKRIHRFIDIKRLTQLLTIVLKTCSEKEIGNELIFNQLIFSSLEGVILRTTRFIEEMLSFLDKIKSNHTHEFKKNNIKTYLEEIKDDRYLSNLQKKWFNDVYIRIFPKVIQRHEGKPNHQDFDELKTEIRLACDKIITHRDTVVAHEDETPIPATFNDLEATLGYLEVLLKDLYSVHSLATYSFNLGGAAANIERSAKELSDLILLSDYEREQVILENRGII